MWPAEELQAFFACVILLLAVFVCKLVCTIALNMFSYASIPHNGSEICLVQVGSTDKVVYTGDKATFLVMHR